MGEPQSYTKGKKPKQKTTYDSIYTQFLKKGSSTEKENRSVVAGSRIGTDYKQHEATS